MTVFAEDPTKVPEQRRREQRRVGRREALFRSTPSGDQ
ncbi:hypothetical protein C882_1602 [Caenispirillum salinarum AK4]|uniref:Uncharacterized protein n=1 Tax=Caenispirillum salinarum AK4 TaxID=1238182 RepID=K9H6T2_9PROT|nr:hypothetical protein C882_1602 [Caenispirillum salinarum AK4]